jgi:hypothetical protein
VSQISASKPEPFEYGSQHEPAQDCKTAASNPEDQNKPWANHDKFEKEACNKYHQDPCGGCLNDIANLFPTSGEAPGMIKLEKRKDDVPDNEETDKKRKIRDFDPHLKKFGQGLGVEVGVDHYGCQGEGKNHDHQIK